MNKFLTFFGCKHSPFDQPDGALDPRLSDAEIGGDDSGGESGEEGPERPSHGHRQQPNVCEHLRICANLCELAANRLRPMCEYRANVCEYVRMGGNTCANMVRIWCECVRMCANRV